MRNTFETSNKLNKNLIKRTKSMNLQSWQTKLVQNFQERLISIFTKNWKNKNIFNPYTFNSHVSPAIKKNILFFILTTDDTSISIYLFFIIKNNRPSHYDKINHINLVFVFKFYVIRLSLLINYIQNNC